MVFRLANQQLCMSSTLAFLFVSLPSLHDYDLKLPHFTCKQTTTNFSFSFWTWIFFLGIQLLESLLTFDKVSEVG